MKALAIQLALASSMVLAQGNVATAQAQRNCAPRAEVLDRLNEKYGETRQGIGLGNRGAVVEVFASDTTGTWTITLTMPNGMTCMIAAGEAYERHDGVEPAGIRL